VLIVDDNPDAAETLSSLLALHGCQVRVASNPHEALASAAGFAPTVAVLDIGLPEMDGYELASRLRERLGPDLRLLAVTGYGQASDHARAREAGFDGHLVKPVDAAALLAALRPDV
jgi:CheY-like chemotaxis protein